MWKDPQSEIFELIPYEILSEDRDFVSFIRNSNNAIGRNQIESLSKIISCIKIRHKQTYEEVLEQENVRIRCLREWKLPLTTIEMR